MIQKEFITLPIDKLIPYENNPRFNESAVEAVMESMRQCENIDPIEVDEDFVILSGHTRLKALQRMGVEMTGVLQITGLTPEQKRKYRLLANKTGEIAAWDFDKLAVELQDIDFRDYDFGFNVEEFDPEDQYEQKKREFAERMAAGENMDEDEEYQDFVQKFELKKTTDDCYTPDLVYDALCGWVETEYKVDRKHFVRPFYPGGLTTVTTTSPTTSLWTTRRFLYWRRSFGFIRPRGCVFSSLRRHLLYSRRQALDVLLFRVARRSRTRTGRRLRPLF